MLININVDKKLKSIEHNLTKIPRSTSDLNIYFMECMEQIEFAGNDNYIRHQYIQVLNGARDFWYPKVNKDEFFDDLYTQTYEMVMS